MKHRTTPVLVLALLIPVALPAVARAKPPVVSGYARMEDLRQRMVARRDMLVKQEEFEKKPRVEKLILNFMRGKPTPEGRKLTGEIVVKEVIKWEPLQRSAPTEESLAVLAQLDDAMRERFALVVPIPKRERYAASKQLVKALTHQYFHIRKAAIESLKAIYGDARFYQPEMSPAKRKQKQKEWQKYIESKRK